jgi:hypothetical protein
VTYLPTPITPGECPLPHDMLNGKTLTVIADNVNDTEGTSERMVIEVDGWHLATAVADCHDATGRRADYPILLEAVMASVRDQDMDIGIAMEIMGDAFATLTAALYAAMGTTPAEDVDSVALGWVATGAVIASVTKGHYMIQEQTGGQDPRYN